MTVYTACVRLLQQQQCLVACARTCPIYFAIRIQHKSKRMVVTGTSQGVRAGACRQEPVHVRCACAADRPR